MESYIFVFLLVGIIAGVFISIRTPSKEIPDEPYSSSSEVILPTPAESNTPLDYSQLVVEYLKTNTFKYRHDVNPELNYQRFALLFEDKGRNWVIYIDIFSNRIELLLLFDYDIMNEQAAIAYKTTGLLSCYLHTCFFLFIEQSNAIAVKYAFHPLNEDHVIESLDRYLYQFGVIHKDLMPFLDKIFINGEDVNQVIDDFFNTNKKDKGPIYDFHHN